MSTRDTTSDSLKTVDSAIFSHTIPAGHGFAIKLARGQRLAITDICGEQVTDLLAFDLSNTKHRFSRAQTKKLNSSIWISTGGLLYSNVCVPMLEIVKDTVGQHDMQFSPCGREDNLIRFGKPGNRTCIENLIEALAVYEIDREDMNEPFGIFFNMQIDSNGNCETQTPKSKPGDCVEFLAQMDLLIGLSACPQIFNACNGYKLTPIKVEVYSNES